MRNQKYSIPRLKKSLDYLLKSPLYFQRLKQIRRDEIKAKQQHINLNKKSVPKLFNLDLHIGVIADLEMGLKDNSASLTRWSISMHNHLVPGRIPVTDPVRFVNARKWHLLNDSIIERFQKRYRIFLNSFDGFICTYPPTFAELYRNLNKPILIVAATRYEAPYTGRPDDLKRFDEYLISGVRQNQILLYANNQGDADYINFNTGLNPKVVPSLCEKPGNFAGNNHLFVTLARDQSLVNYIEKKSGYVFKSISTLGKPYQWIDLIKCSEVLVFPQNISTMTLFELATAGVPVAIPSRTWIKELMAKGFTILNELTFHQILNINPVDMSEHNPSNYNSKLYLDWWLDRADFYNKDLMPNIRIVNSLEDLIQNRPETNPLISSKKITRNAKIAAQRETMILDLLNRA